LNGEGGRGRISGTCRGGLGKNEKQNFINYVNLRVWNIENMPEATNDDVTCNRIQFDQTDRYVVDITSLKFMDINFKC
jgi:hypothetical protein